MQQLNNQVGNNNNNNNGGNGSGGKRDRAGSVAALVSPSKVVNQQNLNLGFVLIAFDIR